MRRTLGALGLLATIAAACSTTPRSDPFASDLDATTDAADSGKDARADVGPDADPTLGGPCVDDKQCDDHIACTTDKCDETMKRCRYTGDGTLCDDGIYCNGQETCQPGLGCRPGSPVTCSDNDPCTIGSCDEKARACTNTQRDSDGDGDPDDHCVAKHDCNDSDPTVSSLTSEICGNSKDDNCNGQVDEVGCVTAKGDTCTSPLAFTEGLSILSTAGATFSFSTSCPLPSPIYQRDILGTFTVPPGLPRDVEVTAVSQTHTSVAILGTCGDVTTEKGCGLGTTQARARARSLPPGTYTIVVATQYDANVSLKIALLDATTAPTNEACTSPQPVLLDTPFNVSLVGAKLDLPSRCTHSVADLTYSFTLTQPKDVRIFASTTFGKVDPIVSLRTSACTTTTDEIACRTSNALPVFARNLGAGTYVVAVGGEEAIDATVSVQTSPPTVAPPDQSCGTAPAIPINATTAISLADRTDAIKDGCFPNNPNGAYTITLTQPSDVMVVGRFPQTEAGAISLLDSTCNDQTRLACAATVTPVRTFTRNVPAGSYRIAVTDEHGLSATLTPLARASSPATIVSGAEDCSSAFTIADTGGLFTGDTTLSIGNYDHGCDAPTVPTGGAPDQVGKLVLTQKKRVVLELTGTGFIPILEVQKGATCPAQIVKDACHVGFSFGKSFLDLELDPGTYFVFIDGYNMAKGPWTLNAHVIDP